MESRFVLLLTLLNSGCCEWVLLPALLKQNEVEVQTTSPRQSEYCFADSQHTCKITEVVHNLTTIAFGSVNKDADTKPKSWEVSMDDVEELFKETEKLPKSVEDRTYFVRRLAESLEREAEARIKNLFKPGSREARTAYFPFPSMEGSLMTISMLLFGVYLSKLILKLLQSQYNRYNTNIGMMGGIRGPIRIIKARHAKEINMDLKKINLMHLIDKYNAHFN